MNGSVLLRVVDRCAEEFLAAGGRGIAFLQGGMVQLERGSAPASGWAEVGASVQSMELDAYGRECGVVRWHVEDVETWPAHAERIERAQRCLLDVARLEREVEDLSAELANSYESINLVYHVADDASQASSPAELGRFLLGALVSRVRARAAAILLTTAGRNPGWEVVAHVGEWEDGTLPRRALHEPVFDQLFDRRAPLVHDSIPEDWSRVPVLRAAGQNLLCAPLVGGESTLGAIVLVDRDGGAFTAEDSKLADTVASYGAALLRGMQLAQVTKELEIGQRIQRSLLPRSLPDLEGVQMAGRCSMARVVGGDFYDAAVGDDGELRAVIADVSGHDLGSALLMATARALFRTQLRSAAGPAEIVRTMNETLHEDLTGAGLFLSFFVIQFDPETGLLRYSAGGHNPLMVIPADRDEVVELPAPGLPAGVSAEATFEEGRHRLRPGDLLLLYTDGFVEATNPQGEMFGEERLGELLRETRRHGPERILQALEDAVLDFRHRQPLNDDGTALLLKRGIRERADAQEPVCTALPTEEPPRAPKPNEEAP